MSNESDQHLGVLNRLMRRERQSNLLLHANDRKHFVSSWSEDRKVFYAALEEFLHAYQHEIFIVDRRYELLAQSLQEQLENEFSDVHDLSVVILGSAVHGGAVAREVTNTLHEGSDLDWSVLSRDPIDTKILIDMLAVAKNHLSDVAESFGLDGMTSCETFNCLCFSYTHLRDTDQALAVLKNIGKYETIVNCASIRQIMYYLSPSFPTVRRNRNIQLLQNAWKQLSQADPSIFQRVKSALATQMINLSRLNQKHIYTKRPVSVKLENEFPNASRIFFKNYELLRELTAMDAPFLAKPLLRLLEK